MTCQDGANAFYDSLKIRTGRVNRDKIELSSPLDRQPSFLSSRCCVFLFSTFRGTRPNNRQVVPLFFLSFHSVPICTLLASFHSFPSVLLSFFPDPLGRIQRDTKTRTLGAQRILMHVFARVDVYFSSYFQQLVFSNGTVTIFILARHTAYYRRGDHLRSEFSPSLSFSSLVQFDT